MNNIENLNFGGNENQNIENLNINQNLNKIVEININMFLMECIATGESNSYVYFLILEELKNQNFDGIDVKLSSLNFEKTPFRIGRWFYGTSQFITSREGEPPEVIIQGKSYKLSEFKHDDIKISRRGATYKVIGKFIVGNIKIYKNIFDKYFNRVPD